MHLSLCLREGDEGKENVQSVARESYILIVLPPVLHMQLYYHSPTPRPLLKEQK